MKSVNFQKRNRFYLNEAYLVGDIDGKFERKTVQGNDYFSSLITVERRSGNKDVIPVLLSEKIYQQASGNGKRVGIEGSFISVRRENNDYFDFYFLANKLESNTEKYGTRNNSIHIQGNLVREPWEVNISGFRPVNRELIYFNLAVQAQLKSNLITCYVRPAYKNAVISLKAGDWIEGYGRIQSRIYDESPTYLVSIAKINTIGYKGTRVTYSPAFPSAENRD